MRECSSITLPVVDVKAACEFFIQDRKETIARNRERMIAETMLQREWFGLGKFYTREKAIAVLCEGFMPPYQMEAYGWTHFSEIQELLAACNVAIACNQGVISVSASVASTLKRCFATFREKP